MIDRDGAVLFAKPAAERLLGIPFSHLVSAQFGFPHTPGGAIEIEVVAGGAPRVAEMRVVVDVKDGVVAAESAPQAPFVRARDYVDRAGTERFADHKS